VRLISKYLIWAVVLLLVGGCAPKRSITWPPGSQPVPTDELPPRAQQQPATQSETPPAETEPEKPNPRALAALTFSDQGRAYIESGNPDAAIQTLERAVNLYPQSGINYYYLAEAWLMKKNLSQATEYNHLAAVYFKDDPEWMSRAEAQLARIQASSAPEVGGAKAGAPEGGASEVGAPLNGGPTDGGSVRR
jgi:tetratricopeptide (TPR) repeat protein